MATSFVLTYLDLARILEQIKIAERHAAGESLTDIIGQSAALLPMGLRTVDGSFNHLLPGDELTGAADGLFPRLLTPTYLNQADGETMSFGPGAPTLTNTNYAPLAGSVVDADPRIISNFVSDQTLNNVAALEAALLLAGSTNIAGDMASITAAFAVVKAATTTEERATALAALEPIVQAAGLTISADGSIAIEARSPDIGLSPPNSGWMTLFGQFFDHGLDLVTKGGAGTVYMPLAADDPLIAGADQIFGTADDLPAHLRFMALTRATQFESAGADGILLDNPDTLVNEAADNTFEAQNTTTPFIDQNQTYTSHASHQVFLREYTLNTSGDAVSTGRLLNGVNGGIATWAEVKAQAKTMLGITLTDMDVHDVPLLATDPYGRFIPGPNGYAQVVVRLANGTSVLVEGTANGLDLTNPIPGLAGETVVRTGHAFLNDIAHTAAPAAGLPADADTDVGNAIAVNPQTGRPLAYDNEMLDSHFIMGDGRGNENIGLTAVHTVFHSEHNRVVEANKATLIANGDAVALNEWLIVDVAGTLTAEEVKALNPADLVWDGERLFQSARFVTEMQYQHMVFEEFARRLQPNIDPFVFTNSPDLNPSIVAEFAHAIYRFGHSQLTDTVDRLDNDLTTVNSDGVSNDAGQMGLIEAFLNPQAFTASAGFTSPISDEIATGAIVRGMSRQVGAEIDEFIVEALRNNLLGLPLDLAALNIARGRETGIPSLNDARAEIYANTLSADLKPYTSWLDFAQHLKHPLSILNFIAAYGSHTAVASATTMDEKREAATLLVLGDGDDTDGVTIRGVTYTDRHDFLNATGAYTAETSGLNDVDLWIGGLAEEINEFGGQLGSTFNYVFEYQMEHLQNGDRFYYLSRTQGMNLLNLLEANTFADMIMRNTDLGDLHSTHLPALIMSVPDMILELDEFVTQANYGDDPAATIDINAVGYDRVLLDPTHADAILQAIDPKVVRELGTVRVDAQGNPVLDADGFVIRDGGILTFSGGEHVVLGGTEGNDIIRGDKGIDTLWGDGGDDYLNAGMESDNVFGGDGDDIIEDPFGDDFLRGEAGNDVIVNGSGLDILFGGEGNDFIGATTDTTEIFAGPGDDFLLGGTAPDVLMGNEGDDWIEGGEGFDGLAGDNSELFFNSPIIGHDVLNGQGNDTDYDGETGDDIMFQAAGIQRNNGMLGFDWAIHKGDDVAANSDLGITRFDAQTALTLRDRFDSVEGLSGWKHDDILTGTNRPTGAVATLVAPQGGAETDSFLLSQNVSLISGLAELIALAPGVVNGLTAAEIAALEKNTVVFDPSLGGDILLGGAGSDTMYGKSGNDIMDGDSWLNVKIAVHAVKNDYDSPVLFYVDSLAEVQARLLSTGADHINPGQLRIVREIVTDGVNPSDNDVAKYAGSIADYTVTRNADGTYTVVDNVNVRIVLPDGTIDTLLGDEGTDTLRNIEVLRFADGDIYIGENPVITTNGGGTTATVVLVENTTAVATVQASDATPGDTLTYSIAGGADQASFQIDAATGALSFVTAPDFEEPTDVGANNTYIVVVRATDEAGHFDEQTITVVISDLAGNTVVGTNVASTLNGTAENDTITGGTASDTLNGLGGRDILNGGTGNVVDRINGGGGNDTINYAVGNGADIVDGGAGLTDTLVITGANGTANDTLGVVLGGAVLTSVAGGAVTNVERVTADLGAALTSDTLSYAGTTAANIVSVNLTAGTASGFFSIANIENVTGGDGNDTLIGTAGANNLIGGAGNDRLDGAGGQDILTGGLGDDTYVTDGNDTITEALNQGTDTVEASVAFTLAANLENLKLTGLLDIAGTGSAVANVLTGNAGANVLSGLAGNDTLLGGLGNDTLNGGTGNDVLSGQEGADTFAYAFGDGADTIDGGTEVDTLSITGAAAADTLDVIFNGTALTTFEGGTLVNVEQVLADLAGGTDVLTYAGSAAAVTVNLGAGTGSGFTSLSNIENVIGGNGDDNLTGSAGNNSLTGGIGNDRLAGNGGTDTLIGGAGNDTYVTDGGDTLTEVANAGTDTVEASLSFTLANNFENLTLVGNAAINGTGNAVANTISGNDLANILKGLNGADILTGGLGDDTFDYDASAESSGANIDRITDYFGAGVAGGDVIDLSTIDANTGTAGNQAFTYIGTAAFTAAGQLRMTQVGGDTIIQGNTNAATGTIEFQLTLTGTHTLIGGDFIL